MTATTWDFDLSHSSVNFHVRHLMVSKVHGRFQTWGGSLVIDNEDITHSRVEVEIDTSSVDTKEEKLDAHLRSADFFDVENHPKLVFKSTSVKKVSGDELEVTGDLTISGTRAKSPFSTTMISFACRPSPRSYWRSLAAISAKCGYN